MKLPKSCKIPGKKYGVNHRHTLVLNCHTIEGRNVALYFRMSLYFSTFSLCRFVGRCQGRPWLVHSFPSLLSISNSTPKIETAFLLKVSIYWRVCWTPEPRSTPPTLPLRIPQVSHLCTCLKYRYFIWISLLQTSTRKIFVRNKTLTVLHIPKPTSYRDKTSVIYSAIACIELRTGNNWTAATDIEQFGCALGSWVDVSRGNVLYEFTISPYKSDYNKRLLFWK